MRCLTARISGCSPVTRSSGPCVRLCHLRIAPIAKSKVSSTGCKRWKPLPQMSLPVRGKTGTPSGASSCGKSGRGDGSNSQICCWSCVTPWLSSCESDPLTDFPTACVSTHNYATTPKFLNRAYRRSSRFSVLLRLRSRRVLETYSFRLYAAVCGSRCAPPNGSGMM